MLKGENMLFTADEVLKVTGGSLWLGEVDAVFEGLSIDSREIKEGDLFFPLRGAKEDGHSYILGALQRGARGSLLESAQKGQFSQGIFPPGKCIIIVKDSQQSLQKLASYHRNKFEIPFIAVTGSSGKTTTKDFIASVLSSKYKTLKTEGNFNNHLGLPLTLLCLRKGHEAAVLELGMSGRGEIAFLTMLSRPSIGVITNIGEAHIGLLGSKENIAKAKGELLLEMGSGATALLNGDDPLLLHLGGEFKGQVFYYGFTKNSHFRVINYSSNGEGTSFETLLPDGSTENFWIPFPGKHHLYNALAAIAAGWHCMLTPAQIKKGLLKADFSAMRLKKISLKSGFYIVNDAYNANPDSMKFALQSLKKFAGSNKKIAILGDMLELGSLEEERHLEIGAYLVDKIDCLITVGRLAALIAEGARSAGFFSDNIFIANNQTEAIKFLGQQDLHDSFILVKGSRGMYMEGIVEKLLAKYN
jgi:UDP-N-acetylmuramoyl-tripeptide--D-alanyl-D-alanine ligase